MADGTLFPIPDRAKRRRVKLAPSPIGGRPQPQWPLDDGITIVLFAGMGGACDGLEEAGLPVAEANNHDDVALAAHAALHPHTHHIRGDIFDVDPEKVARGRRVRSIWGSPDCTDHSVAKGGAPRSPRVRSLPWQICRWAAKTDAEIIYVENVREIRGWGPLVAKRCKTTGRVIKLDGSVAAKGERVSRHDQSLVRDKKRLGRSFRRWKLQLQSLGYVYDDRDLNCADFGVPTARRRFFAVMRRDHRSIGWPARTHAPRDQAEKLGLLPWVAASTIIDWSIPMKSIFGRKRPLADATMRRIAAGIKRYVLDNPRPFIVPLTHSGGVRAHDGNEPLPTITTAHRGELAIIAPVLTGCGGRAAQVPPASVEDCMGTLTTKGDRILVGATLIQTGYGEREGQAPRALDFEAPIGTLVAGGAKHALVAAWMIQHNLGVVGHGVDEPLSTMTTTVTQQQLGAAFITKLRGKSTANGADEPLGTVTCGGGHLAATTAFLTKFYGQGGVAQGCDEPLHTLSTLARFGVVTVQIDGEPYAITDICMRMLDPKEAAAAHELTLPEQITIGGKTRKLTKSEAMRLVGNSVPKRMARLLAEANAVHALDDRKLAAD